MAETGTGANWPTNRPAKSAPVTGPRLNAPILKLPIQ
jgi:hypothetical protein